LGDLGRVGTNHLVQLREPAHPLGHPPVGEHLTLGIHHAKVVVVFRPVDPDEDHMPSFLSDDTSSPRGVRGVLMDQCSMWHDIPSAVGSSPPGGGTI